MEFEVLRMFDAGVLMQKHTRVAARTLGRLTVLQEHDAGRNRAVLVARLNPTRGHRPIPPLFDVQLVSATPGCITLVGIERIEGGALQREQSIGQSWILAPVADDDLIRAETLVNQLSGQLHDLRRSASQLEPGAASTSTSTHAP